MEILLAFLVLFGFGAFLGLAYVGVRAAIMAVKGLRFAAKDLARISRESWEQGKADHAAAQAKSAPPPPGRS